MSTPIPEMAQKPVDAGLFRIMTKMASKRALSLAEERLIADYLSGYQVQETGFPGGPAGDVRGDNDLYRTNWFNGRYLTAEALSRQDTYFDARSRLNAHSLMPGVAWGLGLLTDGANGTPVLNEKGPMRRNGFPVDRRIELQRGLAFDHVGRPILVARPFSFTVEQLIGTYRKTPQRVVGGGTEFAPCVCLAPDPAGPTGGGAAVPTGPYLLVIEPGETPQGGAKVMGDLCGGTTPVTCQADAWRGGFGLSLVRFPVELPLRADLHTAWDLRGTLSGYYFDVFEHPLWRRWDPEFLSDRVFCRDTGPGRHDGAAVALAMLYLGEDGTVLFLDQWIPRRTICDTPAEDWHRTRFGAPPRAAAWARIHQFQCMLAESLVQLPQSNRGRDLYTRGFRRIPPIGFLPLRLAALDGEDDSRPADTGIQGLDSILSLASAGDFLVSPLVSRALAQARGYFNPTNCICYGVVALHDEDILEDLNNVFDKDPIQLTRPHWSLDPGLYKNDVLKYQSASSHQSNPYSLFAGGDFLAVLDILFRVLGLEHLVNRRTEIVKLVVPLQGLTREHPLLGRIAQDALPQAAAWGVNPATTAAGPLANLDPALFPDAAALAGIMQRLGLDMLPRHFVVYVKQRLVLLDLLFYVLELLQVIIELVAVARALAGRGSQVAGVGSEAQVRSPATADYRRAFLAQPAEKRAITMAVLGQPDVQHTLVRAADISGSDLAITARNQSFRRAVDLVEAPLAFEIADPAQRRQTALDRVADAYAAEFPDYQVMQLFAAVQPPDQTLAVVDKLAAGRATERTETLADALTPEGPKVFTDNAARTLYADVRAQMAARPVSDYVPGAGSDLTAGEVLSRSPAEAKTLLGQETYEKFTAAFVADRVAAGTASEALAQGLPAPVADKLRAEIQGGTDPAAAIATVRSDSTLAADARPALNQAAELVRVTGGGAAFLNLVKRTQVVR